MRKRIKLIASDQDLYQRYGRRKEKFSERTKKPKPKKIQQCGTIGLYQRTITKKYLESKALNYFLMVNNKMHIANRGTDTVSKFGGKVERIDCGENVKRCDVKQQNTDFCKAECENNNIICTFKSPYILLSKDESPFTSAKHVILQKEEEKTSSMILTKQNVSSDEKLTSMEEAANLKEEQIIDDTEGTILRQTDSTTIQEEPICITQNIKLKDAINMNKTGKRGRKKGSITIWTHLKNVTLQLKTEKQLALFNIYNAMVTSKGPKKAAQRLLNESSRKNLMEESRTVGITCLTHIEQKIIEDKYETIDDMENDVLLLRDYVKTEYGEISDNYQEIQLLYETFTLEKQTSSLNAENPRLASLRKRKKKERFPPQ